MRKRTLALSGLRSSKWAAARQNQQNGMCAYRRLRSALASAQSDQSSLSAWTKPWVLSYPLNAQQRLWSVWVDAQADLSLHWCTGHFVGFVMLWLKCIWAGPWENVSYVICGQQRRRSACANAQSDQRLCYSLFRQYNISRFYSRNFKTLASYCGCEGRFVSGLVGNPRRHVLSCRGSYANTYAQPLKTIRDVALCLKLPLVLYIMWANSECSPEPSLFTYVWSTFFPRASSNRTHHWCSLETENLDQRIIVQVGNEALVKFLSWNWAPRLGFPAFLSWFPAFNEHQRSIFSHTSADYTVSLEPILCSQSKEAPATKRQNKNSRKSK